MATLRGHVPSKGALDKSMNVNVRMLGAKEASANIRALSPAARRAMLKALTKEAWRIIKTAQSGYVPVLSGDLVFSGHVIPHQGAFPTVEFGFGGKARRYAVIQHENEDFQHPSGGQAKYLSVPVERAMQRVVDSTGQEIRKEFRKFDTRRFE